VLEEVTRARRSAALVEQLRVDQPVQLPLKGYGIERGDRLQKFVAELAADGRRELGDRLGFRQTIKPRGQRVLERGRNGERLQGAA